jgi:hypothetical protein
MLAGRNLVCAFSQSSQKSTAARHDFQSLPSETTLLVFSRQRPDRLHEHDHLGRRNADVLQLGRQTHESELRRDVGRADCAEARGRQGLQPEQGSLSAADQTYILQIAQRAGDEAKKLNLAAGHDLTNGSRFAERRADELAKTLKVRPESESKYGRSWRLYAAYAED